MRRLAVVLATFAALVPAAPALALAATAGPAAVTYRPPVDAPVVDGFRPPEESWDAGNRGLEYATAPGTPVGASAGGEVVFAGPVAGGLHVVVLHDDGLRTSYSFLHSIVVHRGDKVGQGQTVGTAGERFHFGVRAGDAYLDPAKLFGDGPPEVHLVPDELRRPQTEAQERVGLARLVRGWATRTVAVGAAAIGWVKAHDLYQLRGAIHFARESQPFTHVGRFAGAAHAWWRARETCTPAAVAAPRLQERRLAVKVAGLGSTSSEGSVDAVDTSALGYAPDDVLRFSYRGGSTTENAYVASDTTGDIHHSAKRLRELLQRLETEHPGVPVDIIAHSQGGLVARAALTDEVDAADPRTPAVRSLITLSSPHRGAPVATAFTMAGYTTTGEAVERALHAALPEMVDPRGTSITQMAEESQFLRRLNRRPLPVGVNVTSIGAREDLVVPAGLTRLDGAHNVIVSAPGRLTEHSVMTMSAQTQREVALGLAGMAPTCQSLGDALADVAVSELIHGAETGAAAAAWAGGHMADKKVGALLSHALPRRSYP